jgi:hypothetical protein
VAYQDNFIHVKLALEAGATPRITADSVPFCPQGQMMTNQDGSGRPTPIIGCKVLAIDAIGRDGHHNVSL